MEGQTKILLCIPNSDLLIQWTELLDTHYTVPYHVLTKNTDWDSKTGFDQSGIVITTCDFAADHEAEASAIAWDLAVFEEANALSGVYQEDNKQAKALYRIVGNAFKVLLTGTPIEKNIMDLYGLVWFIDNGTSGEKGIPCPVSAQTGELSGIGGAGQQILLPDTPLTSQRLC